ncbi:MAG: hypothetical protein H6767_09500 [Candidatus Peribacteria bacterium]|nr:MAG: hypothetical protein H6767_09500 [Candidatus Peribacteria bacterium]
MSVISFFFSDIVYAINSLTSGFRIETTAVQDVESGELCTKITNNDVKPLFIPTNTQEELQSFLDHPPSSIVYEDCVSCPKSQISVDKYTSKVIGTADGNFLMITYGYNGYFSEYAVSKVNTE